MHLPGQGFSVYPGHGQVAQYYSRLAARYLWNLRPLADLRDASAALRRAGTDGLAMADDAGRAHGMAPIPESVDTVEDAYAVAVSGGAARRSEVREYLEELLDVARGELRSPKEGVLRSGINRLLGKNGGPDWD